jgi:hypothetical protein
MTVRKIIELINFIKGKIGEDRYLSLIKDYLVTIQNNSNNLVLLKELTDKSIIDYLNLKVMKFQNYLIRF